MGIVHGRDAEPLEEAGREHVSLTLASSNIFFSFGTESNRGINDPETTIKSTMLK